MTSTPPPELSIVIPTWNGWQWLEPCLKSIRAQTFQSLEIIVVDDGSTDDTPAHLASDFPEVQCIVSPVNRGFAPTVNQGIAVARGPWVLLLNNDVTLEAECVENLMSAARERDCSMLCPMVLCAEDPDSIYSAGDRMCTSGRPSSRGYRITRDAYQIVGAPFGVSGGYGLFRRDVFDDVGVLDEAFVAYFEDADLCFRARWAGHSAALVEDAVAYHIGSASIAGRTWWRTRQCFQNHALLVLKNFSLALLWHNRRAILRERCHQWARVFTTARHEWGALRALGFTLAAWGGLLRRVPGALRARRRILSQRRFSDSAMQALLEAKETAHGL